MRPRVVAASAATLIAAASLTPVTAQAAGQGTLYVNSGNSACDDSGSGTFAAPFCTIQAAADVANPGDVVSISPGAYATGATITRSGTAAAPIIFAGTAANATIGSGSTAAAELTLSDVSHVEIENLRVYTGTSAAIVVDGGSDDALVHDALASASTTAGTTAVHITNGASGITVQDSQINDGVVVDSGATGTILTTNSVGALRSAPISVQGATNTAITGNTIAACIPAISVTDASAGTSIENNVVSPWISTACPTAGTPAGVVVDASSQGGTHLDYNDIYAGTGDAPYSWNGTAYASAADLYAATGQGGHDYNGADGANVGENSPIINSADSAAIGEQATDISGNPRTLDPLVTPTGAGPHNDYDRGATQFQDPYTATTGSVLSLSATKVPVGATVTANATVADTWGDAFTSYEFSYGSTVVTSPTPTATFTPTTPQSTPVEVLVQTAGNSTYHNLVGLPTPLLTVDAVQPLTPAITATVSGLLGVVVSDAGTADAWSISKVTFDFGDQSPTESVLDGEQATHTYAKAGTYTITETVTDANGATASTTAKFTTNLLGPGTLVSLSGGLGGYGPSTLTNIVQAANTGNAGYGMQMVAVTTTGQVEFNAYDADTESYPWLTLSQPGVSADRVAVAAMPNGSTQLIEVTSTGTLKHTVRNADGSWQASGWGTPAGSTGFVRASITALPDGSAQLVAVTTAGVLMHDIRYANGSWQGWRALSQPGVKITDAAIAGFYDGSAQILEVTSTGTVKHDIRYATGAWQKTGWGTPAGSTGIAHVSLTASGGGTVIAAVRTDGGIETDIRNSNGSWQSWTPIELSYYSMASATDVSVTIVRYEGPQYIAVSGE